MQTAIVGKEMNSTHVMWVRILVVLLSIFFASLAFIDRYEKGKITLLFMCQLGGSIFLAIVAGFIGMLL